MKKSKSNKSTLIIKIVLISLFALVLFYIRLDRVYDDRVNELIDIIPSTGEGFSMKRVEKNITLENSAAYIASLKPGEKYKTSLLVKNHYPSTENYVMLSYGFRKSKMDFYGNLLDPETALEEIEEEVSTVVIEEGVSIEETMEAAIDEEGVETKSEVYNEGVDYAVPTMEFELDKYTLAADEWRIIDVIIDVPEDVEPGYYETIAALERDKTYKRNGVNMVFAVGVEFKLDISDQPEQFEYQRIIADVDIDDLAMETVVIEAKKIVGVAFAFLALFFFYKAFTYKGKKK